MPLSETLRFTSFSSNTWRRALSRSVDTVASVISLVPSSIEEFVFLKSNRLTISRCAWSTALRTSCWSSSEVMSKLGMVSSVGGGSYCCGERCRRYRRGSWVGARVAKGSRL